MRSLQEVHEEIERLEGELDGLVEEIEEASRDAAITEASFKTLFAQSRLTARVNAGGQRITVDEVDDKATVATTDARQGFLIAQNRLVSLREALKARMSQLDGCRTQAASFRGAGG